MPNLNVTAEDMQSATRMFSKRAGPRLLVVSFHTSAVRSSVSKTRHPKQVLTYHQGFAMYINDHLTK